MSYVGKTNKYLSERAGKEGKCYRKSPKFWRDIQRYGFKSFDREVLYTTEDEKDAYEKEIEFIRKFDSVKNGYNTSIGGKGASYERDPRVGLNISISKKNANKRYSYDERHRMALGHGIKGILQFDLNNNYLNTYSFSSSAAKGIGLDEKSGRNISTCCRKNAKGGSHSCSGYIWRYI